MAKRNLLLEYSEDLAIKIVKLCAEYKIDSNTVFQIKKSSPSETLPREADSRT